MSCRLQLKSIQATIQIQYNKMHPRSMTKFPTLTATVTLFILFTLTPTTCQEQNQQQQFQAFAQHLADFMPSQSFSFQLAPSQQQTFIFWPSPDVKHLRGMFYITSEETNGLFVGLEHEDTLRKTFWDKKIGVFNVKYSGTGDMKIITKSQVKPLKIYLSYELLIQKKINKAAIRAAEIQSTNATEPESQSSQLVKLLQKFTKVRNSLIGQQQILKSITKGSQIQVEKLKKQIQSKTIRVIFETIVIIGSGILSIFMLRREFNKGYQLIV